MRNNKITLALTITVGILLNLNTSANPIVIYDNNRVSKPIKPYLPFKKPSKAEISNTVLTSLKPANINFNNLTNRFPINTSNMNVGRVKKRTIKYAPNRAICLLGYDEASLGWLRRNYKFLTSINTICFVVNVKTKDEFKTLESNFSNLQFQAMSADDIATQLQLKHYPVLIYNGSMEQ